MFYVFLGGALGSVARYLFLMGFTNNNLQKLPSYINYVLVVNIIGSFLIGIFYALLSKNNISAEAKDFLKFFVAVGFLGGLTTFSSLSMDMFILLQKGEFINTAIYIILSVSLGLTAVYAGYSIMK